MPTTFEVDRVQPAIRPAREAPLPEVFERRVGRPLLACADVDAALLTKATTHPLAAAVHRAFAQHRPLILTPDAVWLTIAQGFAQHINLNSEHLRSRLVNHEGVKQLTVTAFELETAMDWARVVEQFCDRVRSETKDGAADLIQCDFSTTTAVTRVASDVALLDAFQRYFIYHVRFICGIPQVTLLGTVDDWRKIERRVAALARYDLSWWTDRLLPVCRELRRTVEGEPDLDFWQSICMPQEVYGGEIVTGWVARFFPYLEVGDVADDQVGWDGPSDPVPPKLMRNDGIAPWSKDQVRRTHFVLEPAEPEPSRRQWLCCGITLKRLPLGLSVAPVVITSSKGRIIEHVQLVSGFVGVTQGEDLAIQPQIGWGVVEGKKPVVRVEHF
jgi:hypothetical protein